MRGCGKSYAGLGDLFAFFLAGSSVFFFFRVHENRFSNRFSHLYENGERALSGVFLV